MSDTLPAVALAQALSSVRNTLLSHASVHQSIVNIVFRLSRKEDVPPEDMQLLLEQVGKALENLTEAIKDINELTDELE